MKRLIFALVLLSITLFSLAFQDEKKSIENGVYCELPNMNVLYVGLDNPVKIHAMGDVSKYTLSSDQLNITPGEKTGEFIIKNRDRRILSN